MVVIGQASCLLVPSLSLRVRVGAFELTASAKDPGL